MNENFKSGFVAIIGRPNVGKSTLMNHLIGQKIAITSKKPQTTRNRIQTVYTCDEGQIVFLDTPGIHKAKNKLGEYMVQVAERTLKEVDAIMWLVEPSTFYRGRRASYCRTASGNRSAGNPDHQQNLILYQRKKSFLPLTPTESMRFRRDYPMLRTAWTEYTGYYRLYPEISALRSYVL